MERFKTKQRKVCERCLIITLNNETCPKCGHSQLRDIIITGQAGRNKRNLHPKVG
ncbi:hypothetical protein ACIGC1_24920 [Peribacillus butanolivorans]|uniref:hypothetical protein n=1 Tax=Peribacillus butanolivorans TaxID=421767 RepID=UPI0037C8CFDA